MNRDDPAERAKQGIGLHCFIVKGQRKQDDPRAEVGWVSMKPPAIPIADATRTIGRLDIIPSTAGTMNSLNTLKRRIN